MRRLMVVLAFAALLPCDARAQIVRGVVLVDGGDAAIETALIRLIDARGQARDSAVTDSLGRFVLSTGREGRFVLHAQHLAFTAMARPIELVLGYEVTVELRMAPNAIALEPLIVTGRREVPLQYVGFYRRSRSGMGRFLTREDIERRQPNRTIDLFQVMPRVSITNAGAYGYAGPQMVTMRTTGGSQCAPAVFVDGMPSLSSADLDTLLPQDIDGIEVYTSPAMTPAEYQRNTNCGAILFWLRKDVEGRAFTWTRLFVGLGAFLGLVLLAGS